MDKQLKKELDSLALRDNAVMKVLKVSELAHIVAQTDRGALTMKLRFQGTGQDYRFVLDAVPVSDDENEDIMRLLGSIVLSRAV